MENPPNEVTPLRSGLTFHERVRHSILRHRLSLRYVASCVAATLLAVALMVYSLCLERASSPRKSWLLVAEGALTFFIVLETGGDLIVEGCGDYWRSKWNIFDVCVCWTCLLSFGVDVVHWTGALALEDYVSLGLLLMRYVAQTGRIVRLLHGATKAKAHLDAVDESHVVMHT